MPDPTQTDFHGCYRACRVKQQHTLQWGGCEHATPPETTVSMSKVFTDTDGYPSIGFAQYTVDQLAELLDPVLGSEAMRARKGSVDLAHLAAHAIVHRNDEPAAPAVPAPATDRAETRARIADALRYWVHPTDRGTAAAAVLAVLPAPDQRAAVLLEAADFVDVMSEGCSRARPCTSCNTRDDVSEALRRLAGEAQQDEGDEGETDEQRADREETERDHAAGDHTHCGITCETELPTEHLRNFVIAKGYPGTKGALDELLRRAAAGATRQDPAQDGKAAGDWGAVLRRATDRIAAEIQLATRLGLDDPRIPGLLAAVEGLRQMADCPACEAGIEHDVHCPTPETHNWGCGCPTDPEPIAARSGQPETDQEARRD